VSICLLTGLHVVSINLTNLELSTIGDGVPDVGIGKDAIFVRSAEVIGIDFMDYVELDDTNFIFGFMKKWIENRMSCSDVVQPLYA
jgi:hypothetical protein